MDVIRLKDKYVLTALSCVLLVIFGLTAYNLFFTITVQDISGGGAILGDRSSNVSFTIVNNMFFEKNLSYRWELEDGNSRQPLSEEFTGSGNITLPARSSCTITSFAPPPRYFTRNGGLHYFEGEGTHLEVQVFDRAG